MVVVGGGGSGEHKLCALSLNATIDSPFPLFKSLQYQSSLHSCTPVYTAAAQYRRDLRFAG